MAPLDAADRVALAQRVRQLAREKNAVILAHSYQVLEVQDVADHLGDSLGLAIEAGKTAADIIVFCGVHFMAETAKIMCPGKKVLLPNLCAGCALADSITPESLAEWKERYPDHAVVTYVNSSAAVKAMSDICCTSANAVSVVRSLPDKKILFTPDANLGQWVRSQVPDKEIVIYDGSCPVHDNLRAATVRKVRLRLPDAIVMAHPECRREVLELADEIASTTGMLGIPARYPETKTFIVATENGILHQLKKRYPDKEFVLADGCLGGRLNCPYMKYISLEDVERSLVEGVYEVDVDEDTSRRARLAVERMLAVPRDN